MLLLVRPVIATVVVWRVVGISKDLIGAIINFSTQDKDPRSTRADHASNWPTLMAAVLILMIPMMILFLALQRYIISGLTQGSVKG